MRSSTLEVPAGPAIPGKAERRMRLRYHSRTMYTRFFGLTEKPFAITPDPRYLYLSERHAEALAHLLYGIDDAGGFVQLTGEVGTGKTTMVRSFLGQLPAHADIALILNPRVTPEEFLLTIVDELHVAVPGAARGSVRAIVDALNRFLLDAHGRGRRVVVIVDEAQQLSADVLEQVRLLTNLETETRKLLQIILVGQPELREVLARNDLRQLAQRITGRYHLDPLSRAESAAYVQHRLKVAGATTEVFTPGALRTLHRLSGGVPRLINVIADRALLGAYTREQHRVPPLLVRRAAGEVRGRAITPAWLPWTLGGVAAAGAAMFAFGLGALIVGGRAQHLATGPAAAATAAAAVHAPPPGLPAALTAAAPAPVRDAPPPPAVAGFLTAHAADTSTDAAFARLFALWKLPFDAHGGRPCDQAVSQGLECLAEKGTLAQLRLLNRPAILSLVTENGVEHQVVVSALTDRTALIEAGEATVTADLLDLQRGWYGEFLVLWRPPVAMAHPLRPGMHGAEVRWLRQGLATVRGEAVRDDSDRYDTDLERLVEDFQRSHRLVVDGIAGEQTQLLLDALVGAPGTPTLHARGG
ncbi:MAG TPA: AAA family ATPase [Steroidobacteraceae bacterium]|nr:AAA family ATPase [Steroidobacteraceae bacterium]